MYLSRITPSPGRGKRREFWERIDDAYFLHQEIWKLFSDHPDRRRDFLFRRESQGQREWVYTLSQREPRGTDPLWQVEIKRFEPHLEKGDRLRFSLRANPTVKKQGQRHDVVLDAWIRHREAGKAEEASIPRWAALAQEAGGAWFTRRAERWGFSLEGDVRVDGYQRYGLPGKQPQRKKKKATARIATCDFEGILTVEDPEVFLQQLREGFGPAKSFGCGLMLVARVASS